MPPRSPMRRYSRGFFARPAGTRSHARPHLYGKRPGLPPPKSIELFETQDYMANGRIEAITRRELDGFSDDRIKRNENHGRLRLHRGEGRIHSEGYLEVRQRTGAFSFLVPRITCTPWSPCNRRGGAGSGDTGDEGVVQKVGRAALSAEEVWLLTAFSFSLQKYPVNRAQCFLRQINRVLSALFSVYYAFALFLPSKINPAAESDHNGHAHAEG